MKKSKFIWLTLPVLSFALITSCSQGGGTVKYTVTWKFPDEIQAECGYTEKYFYGEKPTYKKTLINSFDSDSRDYKNVFDDWSISLDQPITQNITIEAVYKEIANVTTFIFNPTPFNDEIGFKVGENDPAPTKIDWGGTVVTNPQPDSDGVYSHNFGEVHQEYMEIDVYGPDITTITLGNQQGAYRTRNRLISSVILGANITKVPSYAFRGINVGASILFTRCVKEVESYVAPDLNLVDTGSRAGILVPFAEGETPAGWANKEDEEWNRGLYPGSDIRPSNIIPTYHNVTDLGLYQQEDASAKYYYSYYSYKTNGVEKAAITRAAYEGKNNVVTTMPIPSTIKTNYTNSVTVSALTDSCFIDLEDLTGVTFGENCQITKLGHSCFRGTSITNFDLPDSVETIGKDAFSFCMALTKFDYKNSKVSVIDDSTFQCSTDTDPQLDVVLSNNIKHINQFAFNSCDGLQTVDASMFITPETIPTCDKKAFNNIETSATTVYYNSALDEGNESAKDYFTEKGWPTAFTYAVKPSL